MRGRLVLPEAVTLPRAMLRISRFPRVRISTSRKKTRKTLECICDAHTILHREKNTQGVQTTQLSSPRRACRHRRNPPSLRLPRPPHLRRNNGADLSMCSTFLLLRGPLQPEGYREKKETTKRDQNARTERDAAAPNDFPGRET